MLVRSRGLALAKVLLISVLNPARSDLRIESLPS